MSPLPGHIILIPSQPVSPECCALSGEVFGLEPRSDMKGLTDEKSSPYSAHIYPHFLAVLTKYDIFYFQIFC